MPFIATYNDPTKLLKSDGTNALAWDNTNSEIDASADINIGANKIIATSAELLNGTIKNFADANQGAYIIQGTGVNDAGAFSVIPSGTSTTSYISAYSTTDLVTNYEQFLFGLDGTNATIEMQKGGTGTLRPIKLVMQGNDVITIGTGNTIDLHNRELSNITLADATNIILNATTGTKIGTATTQKLGFFNATPVVQPSTTGTTAGFTAGAGTGVNDDSTFTGNTGTAAYTIGDIVKALKDMGVMAA